MEVGQHQELEMTEAAPKLYDIIHPTPVSLKELSAMAISLELWHRKVNEYRTNGQLREFNIYELESKWYRSNSVNTRIRTWINSTLPNLPSTIYNAIEKFLTRFIYSFDDWLRTHHKPAIGYYSHQNYILQDFNDFVCDYDGSIDYVRTAERMMRCERFNLEMKFIVACMYFFEDDIKRIWPSVSSHLSVRFNHFHSHPQLYYWIYRLRNELEKIPTWRNDTVDEIMFRHSMSHNRPSMEYFWNRIPLEKQMKESNQRYSTDFVRFILPKLNEQQLYDFVNNSGAFSISYLHLHSDEGVVILRTWSYVKNIMNERNFAGLVVRLMEIDELEDWEKPIDREKWEYLCSEIWNDTPPNLKQSVIRLISSESDWLENMNIIEDYRSNQIHVEFLLLILREASLKERNSFWHNCWSTLIKVVRTKDLQRVIKLCFENEDEITQFKQNFMINSEVVLQVGVSLSKREYLFNKLNDFVSFCCPELQAARNLKEQILQSVFFSQDDQLSQIYKFADFSDFVKDVSANFKNRLVSSPSFLWCLSRMICGDKVSLKKLTEFIDTFVSTEEALTQIKMNLMDLLKEYLITGAPYRRDYLFRKPELNSILFWCLESDEAVEEFKLTCKSS